MSAPDAAAARREALEARRAALTAELERRRAAGGPPKPKDRRRWWRLLWLAPLLLLLLLRDCSCAAPPPPISPLAPGEGVPAEATPSPPRPPDPGRVPRRNRPKFEVEAPAVLPWLATLRAQVTARGPRLSACFVENQRPGALRWSARVDPSKGEVSDQTFEPTLDGVALSAEQRICLQDTLAKPPYSLDSDDPPRRVSLVVEF